MLSIIYDKAISKLSIVLLMGEKMDKCISSGSINFSAWYISMGATICVEGRRVRHAVDDDDDSVIIIIINNN